MAECSNTYSPRVAKRERAFALKSNLHPHAVYYVNGACKYGAFDEDARYLNGIPTGELNCTDELT
jgi:hypothetical protein